MNPMTRKSTAQKIAEHFGWDVADIRECEYQSSHWNANVKVYMGFDGNTAWSAGKTKPRHRDCDNLSWSRVPSNYPGNDDLWKGV
jgi:hypothetical protein